MISSRVVEAITPLELSKASVLFGAVKKIKLQFKSTEEHALDKAFEAHVQCVLEKLDQRLNVLDDPHIKNVEVVMAKHGLYDAIFQQIISICHNVIPVLGDSVRELRGINAGFLTELQQSFCEATNQNVLLVAENTKIKADNKLLNSDLSKLQETLNKLNQENEIYKEKILELRRHLREAEQSLNLLRSAVSENDAAKFVINNNNNNMASKLNNSNNNNSIPITKPHSLGFERTTDVFGEAPTSLQETMHITSSLAPNTNTTSNSITQKRFNNSNNSNNQFSNNNNNNNSNATVTNMSWDSSVLNAAWKVELPTSDTNTTHQLRSPSHTHTTAYNSNNPQSTPNNNSNNYNPRSISGSGGNATPNRNVNRSRSNSANINGGINNHNIANNTTTNTTQMMNNLSRSSTTWSNFSVITPMNWLLVFRSDIQRVLDEGRCRDLSLNEVLDIIDKLYTSKQIANEKAIKGIGGLGMETMEQHTFRVLEKKYGLRVLAAEHAGKLIQSLNTYSAVDNTVQVFNRVFKNELEEDFRFIHEELSKSIKDLTMVQVMSRSHNKDPDAVKLLVEQKIASGYIYEDEWRDMTNYLYNEDDSAVLCKQLAKLAVIERGDPLFVNSTATGIKSPVSANSLNRVSQSNTAYIMGGGSRSHSQTPTQQVKDIKKLGYSSATLQVVPIKSSSQKEKIKLSFPMFFRTVLDFQLKSHNNYLSNFISIFKDIDKDSDGVLNAAEFKEVFLLIRRQNTEEKQKKSVNPFEKTIPFNEDDEMKKFLELLAIVDPLETDRVTFSSAVTCLSKLS